MAKKKNEEQIVGAINDVLKMTAPEWAQIKKHDYYMAAMVKPLRNILMTENEYDSAVVEVTTPKNR